MPKRLEKIVGHKNRWQDRLALRDLAAKKRNPAKAGGEGRTVQLSGTRCAVDALEGRSSYGRATWHGMQYRLGHAEQLLKPGSAEALAVPCTPARMPPADCRLVLRFHVLRSTGDGTPCCRAVLRAVGATITRALKVEGHLHGPK